MKKAIALIMAAAMALSISACGGSSSSAPAQSGSSASSAPEAAEAPAVNITFCNMLAADHPQSVAAMEVLAPEMAEKTGGKFNIDVQVNGALGSDAEAVEATIMGTMSSCGPACATLANFDPNWYILDVPYVFTSKEQARNALDGELGEFLSKSLEETSGLICLGVGESGMRNISNDTKPITSPSDLAGMKLRCIENKYHLAAFTALGSNPTPMAFGEVYTAMQMHQIDGQDNPITITCTNKFYEVQHYYSITEHMFCCNCVVVNAAWFHSLPEDYQQALRQSVKDMITEQRRLIDENEATYLQTMKDNGCAVNELTEEQRAEFVAATQSVRDEFVAEFGEVGQQMLDMAAKYAK